MRSIQLVAPRTLEERPMSQPPDPGPGEVLVRIKAVGICGSDMHWYMEGGIGHMSAAYPQVLGHEPAGEIVEVGPGVTHLTVGQRVSIEPSLTCGHCEQCLRGSHNNCLHAKFMGGPEMPGLFREYAVVPAHNADPFPSTFSFVKATLIEPVAVIVHILELVDIGVGDTVAVMGAGPIGMLCAAVARMAGASKIYVADRIPHRLELANKMGADVAVNIACLREAVMDDTRGRGVDVVLDAAGAPETIDASIAVARAGGKVVLIGIPAEKSFPIDLHTAMAKELDIQTIKRSNHKGREAVALLESGRIPEVLVTHRLPLERTPDAFRLLAEYADGVGKAVIEL